MREDQRSAVERGEEPLAPFDPAEELREEFLETGAEDEGLAVDVAAVEAGERGRRRGKLLPLGAWLAIVWIATIVLLAVLAPWLPFVKEPLATQQGGALRLSSPSLDAWFGGDSNSRDVFARVVDGTRASLVIGVGAIVFGFIVGGALGVVAGYLRGKVGEVIAWLLDIMLAFPALLLLLYFVFVFGREPWKIAVGLGIVATPQIARIARASTIAWSEREFVLAARAQGAKARRIMVREILPNVLPAMYSIALLAMAIAIVAEAALAQLGAGVSSPTISWGSIMLEGRQHLNDGPWIMMAPAIFIFFTVLSLNYLGDVIRAKLDVRESAL